jgi:hypothetical protein
MIVMATLPAMMVPSMAPTWRNAARPESSRVRASAIAVSPAIQIAAAAVGARGATNRCIDS